MPVLPVDEVVFREDEDFDIVAQPTTRGEVAVQENTRRSRWNVKFEVVETQRLDVDIRIRHRRCVLLFSDAVYRTCVRIGVCSLAGVVSVDNEQQEQDSRNCVGRANEFTLRFLLRLRLWDTSRSNRCSRSDSGRCGDDG